MIFKFLLSLMLTVISAAWLIHNGYELESAYIKQKELEEKKQ